MFDDIVNFEAECIKHGMQAALVDEPEDHAPLQDAFKEGMEVGIARGFEIGYELGTMTAMCMTIAETSSSNKLKEKCRQLLAEISAFPRQNDPSYAIHDNITALKAKFRAIQSMAGITIDKTTSVASTELF